MSGVEEKPDLDRPMSLWEHVGELRTRLVGAAKALIVSVLVCYVFAERIFGWLLEPLLQVLARYEPSAPCAAPLRCPEVTPRLVFTNPVEPLFVYLRVALYAGIFLAAPAILYQLWLFIRPALYARERRLVGPFVVLGTLFFAAGGAFARYFVLPFAFDVLVGTYAEGPLRALPSMGESLDLVLATLLAFGLVFELPLLLTLLARLGLVSSAGLAKYRRHAIVVNVVVAAVVTPTGDPFNLALLAVPLVLFYELGIIGARLVETRPEPVDTVDAAGRVG